MQTVFDVVDLLQLQEIWVRLPIIQAFSRLERRQTALHSPVQFDLRWLMPRLGQIRSSMAWRMSYGNKRVDPAQVPMCALSNSTLEVLFPEHHNPARARKQLFMATYNHFVVAQYRGDQVQTCAMLRALAEIRAAADCLDDRSMPLVGSNYWIPVDITDEIRALDTRYDSAAPDTPATFVVDERFWPLLVKASADEIQAAVVKYCETADEACLKDSEERLKRLVDLSRDWNRSSSVVGLYYQVAE